MMPTAHTSLCGCHLARQHSGARYLCVVGKVGGSKVDACAQRGLRPTPAGPVAIGRRCEPSGATRSADASNHCAPLQISLPLTPQLHINCCSPRRALRIQPCDRQLLRVEKYRQAKVHAFQRGRLIVRQKQELRSWRVEPGGGWVAPSATVLRLMCCGALSISMHGGLLVNAASQQALTFSGLTSR